MSSADLVATTPQPVRLTTSETDELHVFARCHDMTHPEAMLTMVRFALENQEYLAAWMRSR